MIIPAFAKQVILKRQLINAKVDIFFFIIIGCHYSCL